MSPVSASYHATPDHTMVWKSTKPCPMGNTLTQLFGSLAPKKVVVNGVRAEGLTHSATE